VDGATLITDRFELLAFGVKIGRPDGRQRVEQVLLSEPTEGDAALVMSPLQLGGTRHVSAAQFASTSRTRWPWWRRRTATSPPSPGPRARAWCTPPRGDAARLSRARPAAGGARPACG
jgi:hypothetical protein